jgi:hypothetical protein
MVTFWKTINPPDLKNPLVLILAGVEYSNDSFPAATVAFRQAVATSNPCRCRSVFPSYLISGTQTVKISRFFWASTKLALTL